MRNRYGRLGNGERTHELLASLYEVVRALSESTRRCQVNETVDGTKR